MKCRVHFTVHQAAAAVVVAAVSAGEEDSVAAVLVVVVEAVGNFMYLAFVILLNFRCVAHLYS